MYCLTDSSTSFPDDPVYMDNQAHREEYVLNEHGLLYEGVHKHITCRPWHFGQVLFENMLRSRYHPYTDKGSLFHIFSEMHVML